MSTTPSPDDLRALWKADDSQPFTGWDFSYLSGRRIMLLPQGIWDYPTSVLAAIDQAHAMLDMDTGGGEALADLPRRPPDTAATEGYPANVPVARRRLAPLGIEVADVPDVAHLPFADGRFDLVTNRHGGYTPHEVWRVLAPGGLFITQQVGSQTNRRLLELLGHPIPADDWQLSVAVSALEEAGFRLLEQREDYPITRYTDVGAIVYYLKAIPWTIPDFSVDRYFDKLVALHGLMQAEGHVDVPFHQFFIRARKE